MKLSAFRASLPGRVSPEEVFRPHGASYTHLDVRGNL